MENFNIKEFLTENKLTENSKRLNEHQSTLKEARVNVELAGDMEGFRDFEQRIKRSAEDFSFVPCDPVTVESVDAGFGSFNAGFEIKLSNGDSIEYEHESDGNRVKREVVIFNIDGKKIKNPGNVANDIHSTDVPVGTALKHYENLVKNKR